MEKFQKLDAVAAPLAAPNVDTDQVVPARFLSRPRKGGYGGFLFHDLRFDDGGAEKPGFVLNQPAYRDARILVADKNFGCGSSREAAVYCLYDYGFRAVIAPSFGDIFYGNSFKNGFLPIVLPADTVAALRQEITEKPGAHVRVDLERQEVTAPSGAVHRFEIDPFRKECLVEGVDEIALTLSHGEAIAAFERQQAGEISWL
jgi:3-isopropylmalate/(R)-2-methylmalate dehydratase small subunit